MRRLAVSLPAQSGRGAQRGLRTRLDEEELLDQGFGTRADVAANLAEMARLNRWLGGRRALTRHLCPRLAAYTGPVTLLDLGTGNADLLLWLAGWARRHGIHLHAWGLDRAARHLSIAAGHSGHEPACGLLCAEASALPFPARSTDFVVSSLFMHHFAPQQLTALLREARAVARRSVIMSDLIRSPAALTAFRLLPPFLAGNFLTRHDGALSIRRAYRPSELLALAAAAGLPQARVYVHWPWRMTLVVDA